MRHFDPMILGALNQMMYEQTIETDKSLINLLKEIERFVFIIYGLCDYPAHERSKTEFMDYGWGIFHNDSDYSFQSIVSELDDYLFSYNDEDEIEGVFDTDRFVNKVSSRFDKDKGWYSWDELKYFLSEWEVHFKESRLHIIPADKYKYLEKEHIMPQNPDAEGQWLTNKEKLGKRFKFVVHDLGNLSLLGKGANKAVQDIDLKNKAAAYQLSCDGINILKRAGKSYIWGNEEILARGRDMVNFLCKRWRLPAQDQDSELLLDHDDILSTNVKPKRKPRN